MITSFQLNRLLKYHLFLLLSLIGAIPVSAQLSSPTTPARGETALPTSRPVAGPMLNIKDFGAKGDGKSDDTQALKAAMQAATLGEGTIYFPTG
ncbi:MAG: glycosyl hydrolase family 28-related protein, partial [Bacteroidota bacterium]